MRNLAADISTINKGRRVTEERIAARDLGRCEMPCRGAGAGHSGPHRCTFRALAKWKGKAVCGTHLRFLKGES